MLHVHLLGAVSLRAGSERSPVPGDPGKKVLAWLALRPNEFTERERVGEILWPRGLRDSALNSLGRGLSSIRAAIAATGIDADEHLKVGPPKRSQIGLFGISTDIGDFRVRRDTGRLDEALALVTGRPLGDIGLTAGVWVEATQAEFSDEIDDVLRAVGEAAAAAGDDEEVLRVSERRLALQATNEDALCQAALAMQRLGRTAKAVALMTRFQLENPALTFETLELKQLLQTRPGPSAPTTSAVLATSLRTSRYAPTNSYDGTAGFDDTFNHDISVDLAASHTYTFRGISAKYVPPRLFHRGPGLEIVRVVMLDPEATDAVRLRALDRKRNPKYGSADVTTLARELRQEILRSLVGLFDARLVCTIDVGLIASTAVDRIELFDDSVYVSLYHGPKSIGQSFPETMRFSRDAVAYGQHRLDCLRQFDLARHRLQFRSDADDASLLPMLASIGVELTEVDICALSRQATDFAQAFLAELRCAKDLINTKEETRHG